MPTQKIQFKPQKPLITTITFWQSKIKFFQTPHLFCKTCSKEIHHFREPRANTFQLSDNDLHYQNLKSVFQQKTRHLIIN